MSHLKYLNKLMSVCLVKYFMRVLFFKSGTESSFQDGLVIDDNPDEAEHDLQGLYQPHNTVPIAAAFLATLYRHICCEMNIT